MKIKQSHLFLVVILIVLILLTMFNTCVSFKPHYSTKMNYANFEAFSEQTVDDSSKTISVQDMGKSSKKEGFTGLEPASYNTDAPIDRFSGTKGSIECDGGSSGLHNSKGGLCLNDDQTKLLRTRGGNASGGDSQIG